MIIVATALVFYFGVMKKPEQTSSMILVPPKKTEIDFSALKNPVLLELQPFEEILEFTGEIGRENPFILKKTNKKQ
jgi:hypothetical protein